MPRSRDTVNLPSNRPTKPRPKSSRSYNDGAVGLGIVAAMSSAAANSKLIAARPRSEPVPIVSPRPMRAGWGNDVEAEEDDEELLESYTCVVSHVAGSTVRKRVYFDDGSHGVRRNYGASPESPAAMKTADLMNRCYLCSKKLRGLDIIIYSGDKAFCSPECRSRQILNNEYKEDNNVSPCSVPTSSLRVLPNNLTK